MKRLIAAALVLPVALGLSAMAFADDAHHPEKQAKTKASAQKKTVKKPTQTPPKKKPQE